MWVIEVLADSPPRANQALVALEEVVSVTQLGLRLRVLIPESHADPRQRVKSCLDGQGISATVDLVPASLEDVYVATTLQPGPTQ